MIAMDKACYRLGRLGLVVAFGAVAGTAAAQNGENSVFKVELHPVNNSGVSGVASVGLSSDGTQVSVILTARNLESGQVHPQHIHALSGGTATCPTLANDTDGDNLISLEESGPATGPAVLPLEEFPTAGEDGTVSYSATLDIGDAAGQPLEQTVIELHGMTVPGQAYVDTFPVACGQLLPALPQSQGDPGTEDPGTEDPGTEDPGTEDPGTEDPGTEDPGTEDPGTEDPGTDDPGATG
jgi:hypothetical protein